MEEEVETSQAKYASDAEFIQAVYIQSVLHCPGIAVNPGPLTAAQREFLLSRTLRICHAFSREQVLAAVAVLEG